MSLHITNDVWRKRPGYDYVRDVNGNWVGTPKSWRPVEKWPRHARAFRFITVASGIAILLLIYFAVAS